MNVERSITSSTSSTSSSWVGSTGYSTTLVVGSRIREKLLAGQLHSKHKRDRGTSQRIPKGCGRVESEEGGGD